MFLIQFLTVTVLVIAFAMVAVALVISSKMVFEREKMTSFECGFDPYSTPRLPFSLRFFLIAVIFLVFDIEIALLLPLIILLEHASVLTCVVTGSIFLAVLIGGLYHEWAQGALYWTD
uniref:NADH dehydrogenase subunit 3 n=1 Tax=Apachyus feae TaxID=2914707 RepID=UPI001EF9D8CB|nr:NADH dehydrogenase subunit 3 [Apachyus feae]UKE80567.1 NADH dehydrogenase subunit 3 [Apachyus feae]